jgi:hypothetical protein
MENAMAGQPYLRRVGAAGMVAALFTVAAGGTLGSTARAAQAAPITRAARVAPSGAYVLSAGSARKSGDLYSAIRTEGAATLKLTGGTIRNTASSSGLNPAVLASTGSHIAMCGCAVTTSGAGSGVLASGTDSQVGMSDSTIRTSALGEGAGAPGAMAAAGGHVTLDNVNISTAGPNSAALAAGRGGTITAYGGTLTAASDRSPVIHSAGIVTVHNVTGNALGSTDAAVVEGHGSVTAIDSHLTGSDGVTLHPGVPAPAPAGADAGAATFTMAGGSLIAEHGPAFSVRQTAAKISLRGGAVIRSGAGVLIRVAGGTLTFTAAGQTLAGDVMGDAAVSLRDGTTLTGTIRNAALTLDDRSQWIVTGISTLTSLTGATISGGTITNITGNGHDVYYGQSLSASGWPAGRTYRLAGGGRLIAVTPRRWPAAS